MPPQAYTREMLAQAFDWLKAQPQYIRERATTADGLVSMYLQSRRNSTGTTMPADIPSVESFKTDLRNLAENMKSFETATMEAPPIIRAPISHKPSSETVTVKPSLVLEQQPHPYAGTPGPSAVNRNSNGAGTVTGTETVTATVTSTVTASRPIEPRHTYDSQTMEAIQTVRHKLNLSSDSEALRMLVKLGFEKIRSILS